MQRVPRDVSVQLFRRAEVTPEFLLLRRNPARGGFWQPVTGAPLPGESDEDAASREVREETSFEVRASLFPLGVEYAYGLRPEAREHWDEVYGPEVASVRVVSFAAEVAPGVDPQLDPQEHDGFAWCSFDEAYARLDWPIERDALAGRREALLALAERLAG